MKAPIHHFKRYVRYANNYKPPYWLHDGRECWLDTGIIDRHGKKIFEGDIVRFGEHDTKGVIVFKNGAFVIAYDYDGEQKLTAPLSRCCDFIDIEIVGHIEEVEHATH